MKSLLVVYWIHSGGWQGGDKFKPRLFMAKGFVLVSTKLQASALCRRDGLPFTTTALGFPTL